MCLETYIRLRNFSLFFHSTCLWNLRFLVIVPAISRLLRDKAVVYCKWRRKPSSTRRIPPPNHKSLATFSHTPAEIQTICM